VFAPRRRSGSPVPRFLWAFDRQVSVDCLDHGCRHAVWKAFVWFSAFRASATSPTDIEHDLVVIPGIIKRRDIDLSPPVGEWPLFARTGRLALNLARAPSPCPLPHPKVGGSGIAARSARSMLRRTSPSSAMSIPSHDPSPSAPYRGADRRGGCCLPRSCTVIGDESGRPNVSASCRRLCAPSPD
jgi:hypothetical protein